MYLLINFQEKIKKDSKKIAELIENISFSS